ncbi:MAG: class I adenylate-forming enzyme family protein [Lysobacterales bacterium]
MSELLRTREIVHELTAAGGEYPAETRTIRDRTFRVFATAPPSLPAVFGLCLQHGDADFIVCNDTRHSFADIYHASCRLANCLQQRGVRIGDRVALAMRNRPEWVIAYLGTLMSGAVVVPMNSWWTGPELAFGLEDCGARMLLADQERLERLRQAGHRVQSLDAGEYGAGDSEFIRALSAHPMNPPGFDDIGPDDDACIMYTSGSTGHPKGAVSTHRAVISTLMSWLLAGLSIRILDGTADAEPERQPGMLVTLPLFHVTGCYGQFLLPLMLGRKIVLMRRWDAEEAARLIEEERLSNFSGVPTMSRELMDVARSGKFDLSTLEDLMAGGAARPPDQVEQLQQAFPDARPGIGYGLTETNALGTLNTLQDYIAKPASVGIATEPVVELGILATSGEFLPPGESGEICIRSASNMRAYWNRPEETRQAFHGDGWLRTGDVGYLDAEGFLFIVDRIKDIVVRGGENIACLEVEAALCAHAGVKESAVFAVPHERLGETAAAVVYTDADGSPDADGIREWLNPRLAQFKIPEFIDIVHEPLPRLATGKIDKRQCREMLLRHLDGAEWQ